MGIRKSAILAIALMTSSSFAQFETRVTKQSMNDVASQGFRFGLTRPFLDVSLRASFGGETLTAEQTLDHATGISVGYASLPIQELGWTANLNHINLTNEGTSTAVMRLDGNLAYAFADFVNVKGGINISDVTSGESAQNINAGIGFQAGLGFQINRNFGIDLNYVQMNQSASADGLDIDLRESGFEFGINATF